MVRTIVINTVSVCPVEWNISVPTDFGVLFQGVSDFHIYIYIKRGELQSNAPGQTLKVLHLFVTGVPLVPIKVTSPVQIQGLPVGGEPPFTPLWGVRVPTTTGASKRSSWL